jgi:hypothetical protein
MPARQTGQYALPYSISMLRGSFVGLLFPEGFEF